MESFNGSVQPNNTPLVYLSEGQDCVFTTLDGNDKAIDLTQLDDNNLGNLHEAAATVVKAEVPEYAPDEENELMYLSMENGDSEQQEPVSLKEIQQQQQQILQLLLQQQKQQAIIRSSECQKKKTSFVAKKVLGHLYKLKPDEYDYDPVIYRKIKRAQTAHKFHEGRKKERDELTEEVEGSRVLINCLKAKILEIAKFVSSEQLSQVSLQILNVEIPKAQTAPRRHLRRARSVCGPIKQSTESMSPGIHQPRPNASASSSIYPMNLTNQPLDLRSHLQKTQKQEQNGLKKIQTMKQRLPKRSREKQSNMVSNDVTFDRNDAAAVCALVELRNGNGFMEYEKTGNSINGIKRRIQHSSRNELKPLLTGKYNGNGYTDTGFEEKEYLEFLL